MENKYTLGCKALDKLKITQLDVVRALESEKELRELMHKEQDEISVIDLESADTVIGIITNLASVSVDLGKLRKHNVKPLDLNTLEVGTKFRVINGAWDGEIVLIDGVKFIKHHKGILELDSEEPRDLAIEILNQ